MNDNFSDSQLEELLSQAPLKQSPVRARDKVLSNAKNNLDARESEKIKGQAPAGGGIRYELYCMLFAAAALLAVLILNYWPSSESVRREDTGTFAAGDELLQHFRLAGILGDNIVVEIPPDGEQRVLKVGNEIAGFTVVRIVRNDTVIFRDAQGRDIKVKISEGCSDVPAESRKPFVDSVIVKGKILDAETGAPFSKQDILLNLIVADSTEAFASTSTEKGKGKYRKTVRKLKYPHKYKTQSNAKGEFKFKLENCLAGFYELSSEWSWELPGWGEDTDTSNPYEKAMETWRAAIEKTSLREAKPPALIQTWIDSHPSWQNMLAQNNDQVQWARFCYTAQSQTVIIRENGVIEVQLEARMNDDLSTKSEKVDFALDKIKQNRNCGAIVGVVRQGDLKDPDNPQGSPQSAIVTRLYCFPMSFDAVSMGMESYDYEFNEKSEFSIQPLAPGLYKVIARSRPYQAMKENIAVLPGKITRIDLTLKFAGHHSLKGRVVDSNGVFIPGCKDDSDYLMGGVKLCFTDDLEDFYFISNYNKKGSFEYGNLIPNPAKDNYLLVVMPIPQDPDALYAAFATRYFHPALKNIRRTEHGLELALYRNGTLAVKVLDKASGKALSDVDVQCQDLESLKITELGFVNYLPGADDGSGFVFLPDGSCQDEHCAGGKRQIVISRKGYKSVVAANVTVDGNHIDLGSIYLEKE
ncbi:carboxypeptidase-like regulatory domain-containing protein [Planctomycetota bacterium]